MSGPLKVGGWWRSKARHAEVFETVVFLPGLEEGLQLFLTPLPQQARRGHRCHRQQTDTEDTNSTPPV